MVALNGPLCIRIFPLFPRPPVRAEGVRRSRMDSNVPECTRMDPRFMPEWTLLLEAVHAETERGGHRDTTHLSRAGLNRLASVPSGSSYGCLLPRLSAMPGWSDAAGGHCADLSIHGESCKVGLEDGQRRAEKRTGQGDKVRGEHEAKIGPGQI